MKNDILVMPRVKDLVAEKMIYLDGDKLIPTKKDFFMSYMFRVYRKLKEDNVTKKT